MSDRGGADLGSARGTIRIESDLRGVDQASRALSDFDRRSQSVDRGLDSIARGGALFGGVLAGGLALAVRGFAGFESQMAAVGAVTGATGAELEALNDLALSIGKETAFSASEAAAALEELAKAGVSTEDILNGAAEGATNLAAAAGTSVPQAAVSIANALNVFNLEGEDAVHVADLFAAASNKSATSVEDLAAGLAQGGAVAASFGISVEESVAALALFADFGLKGSDAGTSFKTMLLSMLDPTDEQAALMADLNLSFFDAQGNFVGLGETAQMLRDRLAGLTEEERLTALAVLFGSDAVRAANILYQAGAEGVQEYTAAVDDAGAAERQAAARLDTLAGSFESLAGSVEVAAIEFGENLAPLVRDAADAIRGLVDAFSALPEGVQTGIVAATALAAGLALTVAAGAKVVTIARDVRRTWADVGKAFSGAHKGCDQAATCLAETGRQATTANGRMGPLLGSLRNLARFAAAGILIGVEIALVGDVVEGISEGGTPGLVGTAERAGAAVGRAFAAGFGKVGFDAGENWINENLDERELANAVQNKLRAAGFHLDTNFGISAPIDVRVEELDLSIGEVIALSDEWGLSIDETVARLAEQERATESAEAGLESLAAGETLAQRAQREGVEITEDRTAATEDLTTATDEQTESLEEQAEAAIQDRREQEALNREIEEQENRFFRQTLAGTGLTLPFTGGAEDVRAATEEFNRSLDEMTAGAVNAIAGIEDIAPELEGVQAGFSEAGASAVEMALDLANADQLDLTASQRQALGLAEFLGDVETSLARVEGEIANNNQDISAWDARLGLVTSTLGGNTAELDRWLGMLARGEVTQEQFNAAVAQGAIGPFAELDALYRSGALSLEEYNAAQEAGVFLIQRSAGALQDERAEQAKLLPELAEYVRLHDDAAGAVNAMTAEQKGFLAALQSNEGALFLQTLQVLTYLAAVGQIPESRVTKFIADSANASPVVRGIAEDLGLIPPEVEATIVVRDEASPAAASARRNMERSFDNPITQEVELQADQFFATLDDLDGRVKLLLSRDGQSISIGVATEAEALDFALANAAALDGKVVEVLIDTDAGTVVTTLDEIRREAGLPIEVPLVLTTQPGLGPGGIVPLPESAVVAPAGETVTATVAVDDGQARADVAAFVAYADTAFAEHHLLVLGVEDGLAIQTLADFQAALGAYSRVPVPPRVLSVDDDAAILALQTFQAAIQAFSVIPVPPRVLTIDDAAARLAFRAFAEFVAGFDLTAAATVTADTGDAVAAVGSLGAALGALPAQAGVAAQGLVASFSGIAALAGQLGASGGANFAGSFAAAIARGAGLAYQAAYTVAYNAYRAILAALQIGSPSRRAEFAAEMVTLGFVRQLRRGESDAAEAARSFATAAGDALTSGAGSLAVRSVLSDDRTAAFAARAAAGAAVGGGVSIGTLAPVFNINGARDAEAIKREIYGDLSDSLGRALSGGLS